MKVRIVFCAVWLVVLLALVAGHARATTITLTSASNGSNDGSGCTLRDAIEAVNLRAPVGQCPAANGPVDTINVPYITINSFVQADAHSQNAALPTLKASRYLNIYGTHPQYHAGITRERSLTCNSDASVNAGEFRLLEIDPGAALYAARVDFGNGCADGPADAALDYSSPAARGGAIANYGTLYLAASLLLQNIANGVGGAIYNGADATLGIDQATFDSNAAHGGGGALFVEPDSIDGYQAAVSASLFVGNQAYDGGVAVRGGAIRSRGATLVVNSTFNGNAATSGGAIASAGYLGVSFSTFVNDQGNGGAARELLIESGSVAEVSNTLLATLGSGGANCIVENGAAVGWYGTSISGDSTCGGGGNLTDTPAGIAADLAWNGGPTRTYRLAPDSPASGAADDCSDVFGNPLAADQRGSPRPAQHCDAGAYDGDRLFTSSFQ